MKSNTSGVRDYTETAMSSISSSLLFPPAEADLGCMLRIVSSNSLVVF